MTRRLFLPVVLLAAHTVAAQGSADPGKTASVSLSQMQRDREQQAVREGKLIHLLMRNALGLPIDGEAHLALTKGEEGMSKAAATAQLREVRTELARRAAELAAKRKELSLPENAPLPTARLDSAAAAPPVGSAPRRPVSTSRRPEKQPPPRMPTTATPRTSPKSGSEAEQTTEQDPQNKQARTIIVGSANRGAVGRILFKAGKYAAALRELEGAENDRQAELADLFYLARTHEEIHNEAKRRARAASRAAARAKQQRTDSEAAAAKLRDAGRHLRSAGGTVQSVAEYERLMGARAAAEKEATKQDAAHESAQRDAAKHYEKAYSIFAKIEARDVTKSEAGTETSGHWGTSARVARNMLKWIETNAEWTPPALRPVSRQ
ncbi:MAG: hypothetical protein KDC87_13035 [Planctomycetes bacterium]|nr:hypothetical protein [Planctomycetota bacterium]MCB9868995.1 hypothetical protein [Planctomycetota bacterium]MCB9887955.1 hypothetical protein [Planctomycetota bacterium]